MLAPLGNRKALIVGQVVCLPHEGINGADGVAPLRRQRNKGVVEVLGFAARNSAADFVGLPQRNFVGDGFLSQAAFFAVPVPRRRNGSALPLSARSASPSLVRFEIAGRALSTS